MLERSLTSLSQVQLLTLIFAGADDRRRMCFPRKNCPIDAVADITTVQVKFSTRTAPIGPVEVQRYVIFPASRPP